MLAQRLDAHNKAGSLLSAVNGPSITNAEFLETFARVYEERDRISNQLVLTFTQADVEQFSASAWQALSDMHAFGFRFALSNIDHVGMDFASLASRGFAFLRLDASALLSGLPSRDRFIGPDELCQHLSWCRDDACRRYDRQRGDPRPRVRFWRVVRPGPVVRRGAPSEARSAAKR